jgi:predicted TIM-barrel fold metal-dependent hydrolase
MDDVIDFRFRPIGAQSWTRDTTYHYLQRMMLEPTPSFEQQSTELMFEEMEAAGIAIGVIGVPGPTSIRGLDPKGSDNVEELVAEHPHRFVGFGSVEPSDVEGAAAQIKELGEAGVKGVTIDPSTAEVSRQFHDRALYIVIQHGGWPYVRETIGVLYKQSNVFTVPGQYVHYDFPGSADYVHALRRQCSRQILFGSVYPNCGPLTDLREIVSSWGLPADIERNYLHDNAERVLGL